MAAETETAPKPPPNLRVADDEDRECDTCTHYQHGRCELPAPFDAHLPVLDEWLCDRWEKGSESDADENEYQGKNLRDAEREAFVRVRAHTRGRRQAPEPASSK